MALTNIFLALKDAALFNVEDDITTKGLWEKLKSIYEREVLVNKIFLVW